MTWPLMWVSTHRAALVDAERKLDSEAILHRMARARLRAVSTQLEVARAGVHVAVASRPTPVPVTEFDHEAVGMAQIRTDTIDRLAASLQHDHGMDAPAALAEAKRIAYEAEQLYL